MCTDMDMLVLTSSWWRWSLKACNSFTLPYCRNTSPAQRTYALRSRQRGRQERSVGSSEFGSVLSRVLGCPEGATAPCWQFTLCEQTIALGHLRALRCWRRRRRRWRRRRRQGGGPVVWWMVVTERTSKPLREGVTRLNDLLGALECRCGRSTSTSRSRAPSAAKELRLDILQDDGTCRKGVTVMHMCSAESGERRRSLPKSHC